MYNVDVRQHRPSYFVDIFRHAGLRCVYTVALFVKDSLHSFRICLRIFTYSRDQGPQSGGGKRLPHLSVRISLIMSYRLMRCIALVLSHGTVHLGSPIYLTTCMARRKFLRLGFMKRTRLEKQFYRCVR